MPEPRLADKNWTVELEQKVFERVRDKVHEPTMATARGKLFAIDTPPPYPSGRWHIGAVSGYALIDMIARSRRMLGMPVLFPWGVDRNGINIERVVEQKHKKPLAQWDRQEFIDLCRKEMDLQTRDLESIAKRIGMSCDFQNAYATDSPDYRAASQAAFIELWNQGHVVQDLRPNNYCPECGTTIADAEVLREEREGKLYTVKWALDKRDGGEGFAGDHVEIATTRPELIAACQIVLVNPDDERYAGLSGSEAVVPVFDRRVQVRDDPAVDPAFGSGAMMICSYGDFTDVATFRRYGLVPIEAIGPNGRMTEKAGPLAGLSVRQARAKMVELLSERGLLIKEQTTQQKVPICERSRNPIEIINLKEWYVKQASEVDSLRKIAHQIKFHPDKHRQILLDWLDNVTIDWPVSRRRYYHTEIPIWYCKACKTPHVPGAGPYHQPWKQPAPPEISEKGCRECGARGAANFVGEEKVFDTWMDSSISNLYVTRWRKDDPFFRQNFPTSLRPQGRDIVRTWLHYTLLKGWLLHGKPGFEHAWITGLGMDERGRKMSKSLGNIIDPEDILREHGADALRFWTASECTIGDDFRISRERIAGAKKFLSKLFNVSRFISTFDGKPRPATLEPWDEWILAELNAVIAESRAGYVDLNFFRPATAVRSFVWNLFAPHYLEMVKKRAYEGDAGTLFTLHACHRAVLQLLAPIAPFVTEHVWGELYGGDVHKLELPGALHNIPDSALKDTEKLAAFNSEVWKAKKDRGLPLNSPLPDQKVPPELSAYKRVLDEMHGLGE